MVLLKGLFTTSFIVPNERLKLFGKLQRIDENILSKDDSKILNVLLFGERAFNDIKNTSVLIAPIEYILMLPYSKTDAYLFVYVQLILTFYQEIFRSFTLFSSVFSTITIAYFR